MAGLWVRLGVVTACVWGGAGVGAQPEDSRDEAWLERIVPRLDSDSYAEREKASEEIGGDEGVSLALVEKRLTDAARPLTPEQSLRLSEAGLKHFANSQRGAMGVSFALTDNGAVDGVRVGGAVDGFDSKRVLRPGDVIREMDGVSLAVNDQLRSRNLIIALIVSHDPGDEVVLDLVRGGEPVVVRLKLGNYKDLRNANELDISRLRTAWDLRCRRARGGAPGEPEAAEAGMSAERWNQISDPVRRMALRRAALLRQQNVNAFAPQAEPGPEEAGTGLIAAGASRALLVEPPMDFSASERGNRNSAEARNIQQQMQMCTTMLQQYRAKLRDPNLPEGQRRGLQNQVRMYEQQLSSLRARQRQMREP